MIRCGVRIHLLHSVPCMINLLTHCNTDCLVFFFFFTPHFLRHRHLIKLEDSTTNKGRTCRSTRLRFTFLWGHARKHHIRAEKLRMCFQLKLWCKYNLPVCLSACLTNLLVVVYPHSELRLSSGPPSLSLSTDTLLYKVVFVGRQCHVKVKRWKRSSDLRLTAISHLECISNHPRRHRQRWVSRVELELGARDGRRNDKVCTAEGQSTAGRNA